MCWWCNIVIFCYREFYQRAPIPRRDGTHEYFLKRAREPWHTNTSLKVRGNMGVRSVHAICIQICDLLTPHSCKNSHRSAIGKKPSNLLRKKGGSFMHHVALAGVDSPLFSWEVYFFLQIFFALKFLCR